MARATTRCWISEVENEYARYLQSTVPEKIAARQKLGLAPKTSHQTYARSMAMSPAIKKLAVRQAATMLQAMLEKYKAPSEDHKQKEPSVKNPKAQSDSPTTPDATQDKKAGGSGAAADQPKAGSEQSDEQKAQKAHYNIKQTKRGYSVNFPDLGVSRNFSHSWLCPEALARAWGTKLQAKHMEWMSWDLAARRSACRHLKMKGYALKDFLVAYGSTASLKQEIHGDGVCT